MTIDIPLTRNELIVSGGAVALGATGLVSAPVAAALAVTPLVRRGLRSMGSEDATTTRTATARRTAGRGRTSGRSASAPARRTRGSRTRTAPAAAPSA